MGVLAHRSAHARPSAQPPIFMGKKCQLHVSAESPSNIYPQPLRSHFRSFGTLGQLLKIPPLSGHKCNSAGGRGEPNNNPSRILVTAARKLED